MVADNYRILLAKETPVKTFVFSLVSFNPIEPFINVHAYKENIFHSLSSSLYMYLFIFINKYVLTLYMYEAIY